MLPEGIPAHTLIRVVTTALVTRMPASWDFMVAGARASTAGAVSVAERAEWLEPKLQLASAPCCFSFRISGMPAAFLLE